MAHNGRFYEEEFPEEETLVLVTIGKFDDKTGAYVTLLEYGGREGMINLGEISKRRVRSMAKLLRLGSTEVCMVVSVDEEKGYVNLSKKRVASEDCPLKQEMFAKAKAIHGVMQHVAATNNLHVTELCNKVAWPLNKKYPTAFDAFKKHVNGEVDLWKELDFSGPGQDLSHIQDKLKQDIETVLQRRLIASSVRLQAKCEVACSEYEGIDAVKAAVMEGFKASKEDIEVNIKLVAHPLFILSCSCRDKELGISTLENAMELIQKAIEASGGTFAVKSKPSFLQTTDEKEDKENDESDSSSGSSDDEDQDETMGKLDADFSDLMNKKLDDDADEKEE